MREEKRKIPISVDELFFYSDGEERHFFRDKNPKEQHYFFVLQYLENPGAVELIYHGFTTGVFVRTGDTNPIRINILEEDIKLPRRFNDVFKGNKKYFFINAPKGIDTSRVVSSIYDLDMRKFELVPSSKRTISHKFSEQALSRLGSLSQ